MSTFKNKFINIPSKIKSSSRIDSHHKKNKNKNKNMNVDLSKTNNT